MLTSYVLDGLTNLSQRKIPKSSTSHSTSTSFVHKSENPTSCANHRLLSNIRSTSANVQLLSMRACSLNCSILSLCKRGRVYPVTERGECQSPIWRHENLLRSKGRFDLLFGCSCRKEWIVNAFFQTGPQTLQSPFSTQVPGVGARPVSTRFSVLFKNWISLPTPCNCEWLMWYFSCSFFKKMLPQ